MDSDERRNHEVQGKHPPATRVHEPRRVGEDAPDDDRADEENDGKGEQPPHVTSRREHERCALLPASAPAADEAAASWACPLRERLRVARAAAPSTECRSALRLASGVRRRFSNNLSRREGAAPAEAPNEIACVEIVDLRSVTEREPYGVHAETLGPCRTAHKPKGVSVRERE